MEKGRRYFIYGNIFGNMEYNQNVLLLTSSTRVDKKLANWRKNGFEMAKESFELAERKFWAA